MKPHPDREAQTLAARKSLPASAFDGPFALPGEGAADCRIDLKLLAEGARRALATRATAMAEGRLVELDSPDLWAGTIQDGAARGFMAALEEAISLCLPEPEPLALAPTPAAIDPDRRCFEGKELRRKQDLLVASGGARVRFSRKSGLQLIDRDAGLNAERCVLFEDQGDAGTLDGFEPRGEAPRRFDPAFLVPVRYEHDRERDFLRLEGRLGRRASGFPCRLELEGRRDQRQVHLRVVIENRQADHRLRIRFTGVPADAVAVADCATPLVTVQHERGTFLATTIVRACGRLQVGDRIVAVPAAQCMQRIERTFRLGKPA
jgi:hypothetical protein